MVFPGRSNPYGFLEPEESFDAYGRPVTPQPFPSPGFQTAQQDSAMMARSGMPDMGAYGRQLGTMGIPGPMDEQILTDKQKRDRALEAIAFLAGGGPEMAGMMPGRLGRNAMTPRVASFRSPMAEPLMAPKIPNIPDMPMPGRGAPMSEIRGSALMAEPSEFSQIRGSSLMAPPDSPMGLGRPNPMVGAEDIGLDPTMLRSTPGGGAMVQQPGGLGSFGGGASPRAPIQARAWLADGPGLPPGPDPGPMGGSMGGAPPPMAGAMSNFGRNMAMMAGAGIGAGGLAMMSAGNDNVPMQSFNDSTSSEQMSMPDAGTTTGPEGPIRHNYDVQKGNSLSAIAQSMLGGNASHEDMMAMVALMAKENNIADPNLIHPGQRLQVPMPVGMNPNQYLPRAPAPQMGPTGAQAPPASIPMAAPTREFDVMPRGNYDPHPPPGRGMGRGF